MTTSTDSLRASRRAYRIAGHTHRQVRIELPVAVFEDIRAKVGRRNVPAYLVETIEDLQRRQGLREWLDEMDALHGPPSDEERERARRIWRGVDE